MDVKSWCLVWLALAAYPFWQWSRLATAAPGGLLKNSCDLSFRGAGGDEESGSDFRARFLAALGMTRVQNVVQHPASPAAKERNELLDAEWSPENLYTILTSPNPESTDNLYRAAFEAGPVIIPKLESALKDDRTAEFAAQTLAYLGGQAALADLAKLVNDPRNLDLRRFYYGALGGSDDPQNINILLNKIRTSDQEPDRTATRDAILALSISSDPSLVPKLQEAEKEVTDPVIQDDIETAATVIGLRAKYLASPAGKNSGDSVNQAIRTYFMPALEESSAGDSAGQQDSRVEIHILNLTYSPDKNSVLASVDFENPQAVASYRMVLQKKQTQWEVASVWLGEEREKPQQSTPPAKPK
jgi:hypothetical protein